MRFMRLTLRSLFVLIFMGVGFTSLAQSSLPKDCKPPKNRELFHDYVDREQKNVLRLDGKEDGIFKASQDDEINFLVTQAVTSKIDAIQCRIEKDTSITHTQKIGYLRGLESMLRNLATGYRNRTLRATNFSVAVDVYDAAMKLNIKGESIEKLLQKHNYEVVNLIVNSGAFENNKGFKNSRNNSLLKYLSIYPEKILVTLKSNLDVPFRDSLIKVAGYKFPKQLYDYASAQNSLGVAIRRVDDPLIQSISKMATSDGSGQMYLPFLDNIITGKQTLKEIDEVKKDPAKYYKLLVKTRIDYIDRIQRGEKVYEMNSLMDMLEQKARTIFVKTINDLHDESDAVRFRILNQLSATELYYLVIAGERDLYTSSYTKGVYPLMMQKIGNRGDSLMMAVGFDKFKKFIRMAAGYNTLNNFLKTFPDDKQAELLMVAFVNGLENSQGLEDGVDIADSYVSILEGNKPLAATILNLTKLNYDKNARKNNKRGMVMYNLLHKLFLSADPANTEVDLSKEFGINPVYNVSYNTLSAEQNPVIMQVFFYGDKDGKIAYDRFMGSFPSSQWKVTTTKYWISATTTKGKPVTIYANRWLPEETGEDEKAQKALCDFLVEKNIEPTITIHRGHSYYAPYTIEQMAPSSKIVFLGSCGGYHLIHDVLSRAPEAHIIASKQIGSLRINQPFFDLLNEKMINGNNIDWIPFWNEFKKKVGPTDGFDDYIPPHKNLGAIFIKAYNSSMGETITGG